MKRVMSTGLVLASFALVGLTAGCGSSDQPTDPLGKSQMNAVAQAWADAFGSGDIDAMCDLTDTPKDCASIYTDNEFARTMANQSIERSDYVGNEGVVQFSNGDVIQMRVKNGEWVVFSFGGKQPYKIGYDPLTE